MFIVDMEKKRECIKVNNKKVKERKELWLERQLSLIEFQEKMNICDGKLLYL